jgi:hypothetical protein
LYGRRVARVNLAGLSGRPIAATLKGGDRLETSVT